MTSQMRKWWWSNYLPSKKRKKKQKKERNKLPMKPNNQMKSKQMFKLKNLNNNLKNKHRRRLFKPSKRPKQKLNKISNQRLSLRLKQLMMMMTKIVVQVTKKSRTRMMTCRQKLIKISEYKRNLLKLRNIKVIQSRKSTLSKKLLRKAQPKNNRNQKWKKRKRSRQKLLQRRPNKRRKQC